MTKYQFKLWLITVGTTLHHHRIDMPRWRRRLIAGRLSAMDEAAAIEAFKPFFLRHGNRSRRLRQNRMSVPSKDRKLCDLAIQNWFPRATDEDKRAWQKIP